MCDHLVESRIRVLRFFDADDFDVVELVKSVETSHVFTIRTCLSSEAWGICCKFLRELVVVQDDIPIYIGNRDFCCRHKIEIIQAYIVHLGFLVRELACTETRGSIDHNRRLDFFISGSSVVVQEEADEGSLEFGAFAFVYREACAGEFHTEVEIYDIEFLGEFPVRKSVLREFDFRTTHFHYLVIFCAFAWNDQVTWYIWKKN